MDHSSIKMFPSDRLDEADTILGTFCEGAVVTGYVTTNSKEMIFEAEVEFPNPEVGSHSFFFIGHLEDEAFPFVLDGRKYMLSRESILKSIPVEELENSVILNL